MLRSQWSWRCRRERGRSWASGVSWNSVVCLSSTLPCFLHLQCCISAASALCKDFLDTSLNAEASKVEKSLLSHWRERQNNKKPSGSEINAAQVNNWKYSCGLQLGSTVCFDFVLPPLWCCKARGRKVIWIAALLIFMPAEWQTNRGIMGVLVAVAPCETTALPDRRGGFLLKLLLSESRS